MSSEARPTASVARRVIPTRVVAEDLSDYLRVMSQAVFQAGLSWALIERQWRSFCEAFGGFKPAEVAAYGEADIRRVLSHPGIVHSERKTRATIRNAQTMLALDRDHGGF
ncbi:MAG: DNA-3-methyladenine glycosylase I [Candidatus Eremiobacteraeota bacterium]|nr:DNA-3-methyladenine glycosylase I [Candidatus Eremiobacteraeota bacterium]MBC5828361.1 DNA-3-methyladenine glycosylase I [Candidatus Eremiobacteraeota bacterium]